jgi:hypothetical protein
MRQDGIHTGIAQGAIGHGHVVAEDAIGLRSKSFNGLSTLVIVEAGAELHRDASQGIEGVFQQQ